MSSATSRTYAGQSSLPKLPIPPLVDTCARYLRALEGLQDKKEHEITKRVVEDFLHGEGPKLQELLKEYARDKARCDPASIVASDDGLIINVFGYIEEFWYESYLSNSDPVVLALNPFFVLEDDPTPSRGAQLPRAAALIVSSLGFIHDLRAGLLEPDSVRGIPLDMDQYSRLFGTARVPTDRGCRMETEEQSRHVAVIRRGQFYYFDVLDFDNRPVLTERDILRNLQAIMADADKTPVHEVARQAVGVLTTENRKIWSHHRDALSNNPHNAGCLRIVDTALFVVCLDDAAPDNVAELCSNFLCGTYGLTGGVQVGTCTNRWYDKLQIIVCGNGTAGINFEHTGVDGHTVLRFAADIYTDALMLLARSINPSAPSFFHAKLSPLSKSTKGHKISPPEGAQAEAIDTLPKKLEWTLTPELRTGIRFAETRLSDLICQNESQALEFKGYGKNFITRHGFSPDAFVQMAFQAAYFGLYGRIECTYEPAMTKSFLHGRTEAVRTVQPECVNFTKVYFTEQSTPQQKVKALRQACETHVKLTREASKGLGQDRHLYALYCLMQRLIVSPRSSPEPNNIGSPTSPSISKTSIRALAEMFTDPGWALLNTTILSTSNCGNPALRLFGFGPVAADGFGIGYIIKDEGISVCASSKHLQTRRYLDTLQGYLHDVQRLIIQIHRQANEVPAPDVKTGRPIVEQKGGSESEDIVEDEIAGFSFFESGEVEMFNRRRKRTSVGKRLQIAEY